MIWYRFLGELLHKAMLKSQEYELAMQRYPARPPQRLKSADAMYPSREDVNERRRIR